MNTVRRRVDAAGGTAVIFAQSRDRLH